MLYRPGFLPGILCAVMSTICGCAGIGPAPQTVAELDLQRYAGKWYEIARYPNFFEIGCANVTAEYAPRADGTVSVLNICRSETGEESRRIEGFARVPDPQQSAKLAVSFPSSPFPAPYWVIDLGPDYEYAVVGDPTRNFLWILSRTPALDPAVYGSILDRVRMQGYDPSRLILVDQSAHL